MSDYTVLLFFPKECFPSLERGLARWQNSALWRRILRGQGKCPDAAAKDPTLRLGDPGEPGSRQKRESVMQMHERMWEVEESMSEGRYWAICLKPLPDRILYTEPRRVWEDALERMSVLLKQNDLSTGALPPAQCFAEPCRFDWDGEHIVSIKGDRRRPRTNPRFPFLRPRKVEVSLDDRSALRLFRTRGRGRDFREATFQEDQVLLLPGDVPGCLGDGVELEEALDVFRRTDGSCLALRNRLLLFVPNVNRVSLENSVDKKRAAALLGLHLPPPSEGKPRFTNLLRLVDSLPDSTGEGGIVNFGTGFVEILEEGGSSVALVAHEKSLCAVTVVALHGKGGRAQLLLPFELGDRHFHFHCEHRPYFMPATVLILGPKDNVPDSHFRSQKPSPSKMPKLLSKHFLLVFSLITVGEGAAAAADGGGEIGVGGVAIPLLEGEFCCAMDVDPGKSSSPRKVVVVALLRSFTFVPGEERAAVGHRTRDTWQVNMRLAAAKVRVEAGRILVASGAEWDTLFNIPAFRVYNREDIDTESWTPQFHFRLCHNKELAVCLVNRRNSEHKTVYAIRYKDAKFPVGDGDESNLAYKVELEDQPWVGSNWHLAVSPEWWVVTAGFQQMQVRRALDGELLTKIGPRTNAPLSFRGWESLSMVLSSGTDVLLGRMHWERDAFDFDLIKFW